LCAGIKEVINEKFGDGIMSAIDMYVNVQKVKGGHGEDRVLITLNGKTYKTRSHICPSLCVHVLNQLKGPQPGANLHLLSCLIDCAI
jgi:hypothetical protein